MMKIFKAPEFSQAHLERDMLDENPFLQFEKWYAEAQNSSIQMPNAMSLATASAEGFPSVRTVLLKYFDATGFVFFTNYTSQKAIELEENPQAEILFPWLDLERQVRISGQVEKISKTESFKYFTARQRDSQLGAWCSNQSSPLSSRSLLLQKMEEMKQKFKDGKIPLPSFWGGYKIVPQRFEFWQGRKNRLHDRFQYGKKEVGEGWEIIRLAP